MRFVARGADYTMLIRDRELEMLLRPERGESKAPPNAVRMRLLAAQPGGRTAADIRLLGVTNYYIGADSTKWRAGVPNYGRVRIDRVYPGIDIVYHGSEGKLEYDFMVHPGADPDAIRLSYSGAESMRVDSLGDLVLAVGGKEVRQRKPVVYQDVDGERVEIAGEYRLIEGGREVQIALAAYDRSEPLVIDPTIVYATYLGGGGIDLAEWIAVDSAGSTYITGATSGLFPVLNATQGSHGGGFNDVFVTKLSPTGTMVYSTYLGGGGFDFGYGLAVDGGGAAYVTGYTNGGFPLLNAAQPNHGGLNDAFVAKLGAGGALVYSTYLGGAGDDLGRKIAVDAAGQVYVTGYTTGSFPTLNAYQSGYGGGQSDVFAAKLNATGGRVYATYLGGGGTEIGNGIAADHLGAVYLTGYTSGLFPVLNATQSLYGGGLNDAYVSKLNPNGVLVYSTYLGGAGDDVGNGIAVDPYLGAHIAGTTTGSFPLLNAAQGTFGGISDAFVAHLSPVGLLAYST
ncbi:MAG: SBBP repeat-containing protein, partial [Bryobacteraceae bacterium]